MPKQNIFFRFHTHNNTAGGKNSNYDIIANLYAQPDSYFAHFDDVVGGTQYKAGEPNIPFIGQNTYILILQIKIKSKTFFSLANFKTLSKAGPIMMRIRFLWGD